MKTLLFGASGPLNIKDIQAVVTKFHEQRAAVENGEDVEENADSSPPEQPFLEAEGMPTSDVPSLVSATQIREALDRIAHDLVEKDEVFRLVERPQGYLLVSNPALGEWIRLLRDEPKPTKLSQPALETLAVVAYRQPVVRAEIEKIRGVSVDNALSRLLERELIHVVGRADLPGRPIQYAVTEQFLEFVGIRSVEELPSSDVLSPRQIDEWLHEVANRSEVTEAEMGLPEGKDRTAEAEPSEVADEGSDVSGISDPATEEEESQSRAEAS